MLGARPVNRQPVDQARDLEQSLRGFGPASEAELTRVLLTQRFDAEDRVQARRVDELEPAQVEHQLARVPSQQALGLLRELPHRREVELAREQQRVAVALAPALDAQHQLGPRPPLNIDCERA